MRYLLNLFYLLLIVAASPWLVIQALRTGKYRAGLGENCWASCPCGVRSRGASGCTR